MQFFDTTPTGRIQNLFSRDMDEGNQCLIFYYFPVWMQYFCCKHPKYFSVHCSWCLVTHHSREHFTKLVDCSVCCSFCLLGISLVHHPIAHSCSLLFYHQYSFQVSTWCVIVLCVNKTLLIICNLGTQTLIPTVPSNNFRLSEQFFFKWIHNKGTSQELHMYWRTAVDISLPTRVICFQL